MQLRAQKDAWNGNLSLEHKEVLIKYFLTIKLFLCTSASFNENQWS